MALLAASFASMATPFSNNAADAASFTCENLVIAGVRASGDDGNVPANVNDNLYLFQHVSIDCISYPSMGGYGPNVAVGTKDFNKFFYSIIHHFTVAI